MLTDQEKERCRYHLGYPEMKAVASLQFGIPRPMQTAFLVELALDNVMTVAEPRVRQILSVMDGIESSLVDAQTRLAAISLGDIKLRQDEPGQLEREYVRWGMRLADILGCPIYPFSTKYAQTMNGINIPVRN